MKQFLEKAQVVMNNLEEMSIIVLKVFTIVVGFLTGLFSLTYIIYQASGEIPFIFYFSIKVVLFLIFIIVTSIILKYSFGLGRLFIIFNERRNKIRNEWLEKNKILDRIILREIKNDRKSRRTTK